MTSPAILHRENNFDFLRMVAASLVLYSHHFVLTARPEPSFFSLHAFGGVAVLIFFSISGYLITQSWYSDPHIVRFALRRILRIWPAFTVVVVLAAYVLGPTVSRLTIQEYFDDPGTARYLYNLIMTPVFVLPGVFEQNPYPLGVNGSLWTIPIEVRAYEIFGLLGLIGLWKKRWVLVTTTLIFAAWYLWKSNPDLGKHHAHRELILYFFAGASLFALRAHWQARPWLWLAGFVVLGMTAWALGYRYLGLTLILPYAAIFFGTSSTPWLRGAGRWGDFSYGTYLYAYPVQQTVIHYLYADLGFFPTLLLAAAITLVAAVLSWHVIEKTTLRLKPSKKPMHTGFSLHLPYWPTTPKKTFLAIFALLLIAYLSYLTIFWPGILGEDGLAIILEAESNREFKSGKPIFWYMFFSLFYLPWRLVEIPVFVQLVVCAILLSRVLTWIYQERMVRTFWFSLIFIALAPHLIFYNASLYSDGIYACALVALLFEVWLCVRDRRISRISLWVFALSIPFAVFVRPNGIINLLPVLAVILLVKIKAQRMMLASIVVLWCAIAITGNLQHKRTSIGTFLPVALWETVNFLQPSPMGLHPPRVTPQTIQTLEAHRPIPEILKFYDRDYWDPLWFFPQGPRMGAMTKEQKRIIVKEFFTHNLWANLPSFLSSRVHVFMVAALAQGGFPGPAYAKHVLSKTQSNSQYRAWNLAGPERSLHNLHDTSFKYRWLLWTPFFGIGLTFWILALALRRRDWAALAVSGCLAAQFLVVFMFSIAGEYRYLMGFFVAPIALMPVLHKLRGYRQKTDDLSPALTSTLVPSSKVAT